MTNCWPIKTIASLVKVGRGFLHSSFPSYSSRQCSILTPPIALSLGWRLDGAWERKMEIGWDIKSWGYGIGI